VGPRGSFAVWRKAKSFAHAVNRTLDSPPHSMYHELGGGGRGKLKVEENKKNRKAHITLHDI
jgi:hypothetical protein